MNESSSAVIVSNEQLWAVALRHLLQAEPGLAVSVLGARSVADAVPELELLAPELVVLDVRGDGARVASAIERVVAVCPGAGVVAVVGQPVLEASIACLDAGVLGILDSDAAPEELRAALEAVRRGGLFLSQSVLREYVAAIGSALARERLRSGGILDGLSEREVQVVDRLSRGMSNAEIARSLCLSEATVKLHLTKVMSKWGVRDRVQVVIKALGG